jgi:hypothetical protein
MKTTNTRTTARVVAAALILSLPGFALASRVPSRNTTTSDSASITNSVVAATSNIGLPPGPTVSPPTEKTPCAMLQNEAPTASETDDPILDDARKGVDGWFTSDN